MFFSRGISYIQAKGTTYSKNNCKMSRILFQFLLCNIMLLSSQLLQAQYYPKMDSLITLAQKNNIDSLVVEGFEQVLQQAIKDHGKTDSIYWHYVHEQAQWDYKHRNYKNAIENYSILLPNIDSLEAIGWYAKLLYYRGKCYKKLESYEAAYTDWKNTFTRLNKTGNCINSTICREVISELSILLFLMDKSQEAIYWNELWLNHAKKISGDSSKAYALAAKFQGMNSREVGNYDTAQYYLFQAMSIYAKYYKKSDKKYFVTYTELADNYNQQGKKFQAKEAYLEILNLIKQDSSKVGLKHIRALNFMAVFYGDIGEYELAIETSNISKEILKDLYGEKNQYYIRNLQNLAILHFYQGDYPKAENITFQVIQLLNNLGLKQHPFYANTLNLLGTLQRKTGRYQQSIMSQREALEIYAQTLGKEDAKYSNTLTQLTNTYNLLDSTTIVKQLIDENLALQKDSLSIEYLLIVENLALFLLKEKYFKKALATQKKVLAISEAISGKEHPNYAIQQAGLASTYYKMDQYNKADSIYKEAKKSIALKLGVYHSIYGELLYGQIFTQTKQQKIKEAIAFYREFLKINWQLLKTYQSSLSEQEQLEFLSSVEDRYKTFNSFVFNHYKTYPSLVKLFAQNNLQLKSTSLNYKKTLKQFWSNNSQDSLYQVYQDWINTNYALAAAYTKNNNTKAIDSLTKKLYAKERILSSGSTPYTKNWKKVEQLEQIHQKLDNQSVVIDFIHFQYYNVDIAADTIYYTALVYTQDSSNLQFIPLCTEKQLLPLLGKTISNDGNNITTNSEQQQELYKLIWKPLEQVLKGKKNIHLVTSGLLQNLPFELLSKDSKSFLLNSYNIHYYNNLKDFVIKKKTSPIAIKKAVLLGDIQFDTDSLSLVKKATKKASTYRSLPNNDSLRSHYFTQLPATKKELNTIQKLLEKKDWKVTTKTKQEATEEFVKTELTTLAPNILHIATHGFYLPSNTELKHKKFYHLLQNTANTLMQSGIALTGANYVWQGNPPITGVEDGVFTAYEATQLDLHQTDLVVLSACQTGLGNKHSTEGVMGLQRAFKQAGVSNLIISLWAVSDQVTAELMSYFYQEYAKKQSAYQALKKAKNKIQKKYKSPFYWAAFVLIE